MHGLEAINYDKIQFLTQVHELKFEKFILENTRLIDNYIGPCIEVDKEVEQPNRNYVWMKVEVNVDKPLLAGFWWMNSQGKDQWAFIKWF